MKQLLTIMCVFSVFLGFSQEKDVALLESNNLVYQGNELIADNDFVSAEMEYRKAISKKPNNAIASYDLGNAYYADEKYNEALLRHTEATQYAISKEQKHKAWHNVGNTLMQNKKCQEAVEAFKNALRNNPNDEETRYNFGLAKECAKQQQQEQEDKNEDKSDDKKDEDKNKDEKDGENENEKEDGEQEQKDQQNNENQNQDQGDDKQDDNDDPKDKKEQKEKEGESDNKKKQPKPQQGQLSPQQIKNLLEAMNNQEQKVQEKINAKKTKGVKVQTDKDW